MMCCRWLGYPDGWYPGRCSNCDVVPTAQTVAGGAGQQALSALHIWSDGQLIKHNEDGFLTSAVPGVVYSGWIVVE